MNGLAQTDDRVPSANLGKRKRDPAEDVEDSDQPQRRQQQLMESVLIHLRDYDPSPSLLKYPLSANSSTVPSAKRPRLALTDGELDNIESRILSMAYESFDEMVEDVNNTAKEILQHSPVLHEQVNGESKPRTEALAKAHDQIKTIRAILDEHLKRPSEPAKVEEVADSKDIVEPGRSLELGAEVRQVLTLRTMTERGPRQVYSGLQRPGSAGRIDGKKLPNGFELIDAHAIDTHTQKKSTPAPRTLGSVFQPPRNIRPLELPRTSRNASRGTALKFVSASEAAFDRAVSSYKHDYAFTRLPTAEWLRYGKVLTGHQARLETEDSKTNSLFQASYSSFAPSQDSSLAVFSEPVRNEIWWDKRGSKAFMSLINTHAIDDTPVQQSSGYNLDLALEGLADGFEAEIDVTGEAEDTNTDKVDDILAEVSTLIETLSSFQRNRSLETQPAPKFGTPSEPEFDMYELLRSQLVVLISCLPPFAVARLNGDQLEELNITTKMTLEISDCTGSGSTDSIGARRHNPATIQPTLPRMASSVGLTVRPSIYTPHTSSTATTATNYNSQARAFNATSVTPSGTNHNPGATPSSSYQTPRPPSTVPRPNYMQTYQQTATPSYAAQTTAQQFQRPIQNGYGNYAANSTPQTSYLQRPTQPGYQQRAQDNAVNYGRSASPQKPQPLVNGQAYHTQQIPQGQSQSSFAQGNNIQAQSQMPPSLVRPIAYGTPGNAIMYASPAQREKIEQMKEQQRQSSGTPQPTTPGSAYGRYEGVNGQRSSVGVEQTREMSASATAT